MELKGIKDSVGGDGGSTEDRPRTHPAQAGGHYHHRTVYALEDVSLYFKDFGTKLLSFTTKEKDHGRIEKQEYRLLTDLSWLSERTEWVGLNTVGSVCSTVTRNGVTSTDARFFITSLTDIDHFAYAVTQVLVD